MPVSLLLAAILLYLSDDRPVPDPSALMKEVQAHQKKMDEVRENYTFHRIVKTQELDGKGATTKTTTTEREIFFVNGHQIARLVAKEGSPLSAPDDKKEQERTQKLTVEFARKPAAFGKGGGVNLISTILAVAPVSNPRRVEMNGRSTLAFDFKGDPSAQAHDMQGNAAKKLSGSVWIDETDRQVARLEVEFYDDFRIAGGLLASIKKGTVIKIEQSPIGEGLWLPTAVDQHMNMRVIAKSLHENSQMKNFDFKKFNVDAAGQIKPPAKL